MHMYKHQDCTLPQMNYASGYDFHDDLLDACNTFETDILV